MERHSPTLRTNTSAAHSGHRRSTELHPRAANSVSNSRGAGRGSAASECTRSNRGRRSSAKSSPPGEHAGGVRLRLSPACFRLPAFTALCGFMGEL
eukprot:scaffold21742_cov126-Isochrysis_galbana.AAC.3